jgi:hypothetical protein
MPFIITAFTSFFVRVFGKFLLDSFIRFAAYKILFYTIVTLILPVVLKKVIIWLFEQFQLIITSVTSGLDGSMPASIVQFTGLAGYFAEQLMLADAIAIILTACGIRLILNFVPFVK